VIKFGGALLEAIPANGLGESLRYLGNLARSRGKGFDVGPIYVTNPHHFLSSPN
jgi:hypothetical protein